MTLDIDPDSVAGHEARLLLWDWLIARKLRDTAFRERRIDDANWYTKQMQATEHQVLMLLRSIQH